jgi:hypothetical protein
MLREMDQDIFIYWVLFLQQKEREFSTTDYQVAALSKIVADMFSKDGSNTNLTDFLVKFQTEQEQKEEQEKQINSLIESLKRMPGAKYHST